METGKEKKLGLCTAHLTDVKQKVHSPLLGLSNRLLRQLFFLCKLVYVAAFLFPSLVSFSYLPRRSSSRPRLDAQHAVRVAESVRVLCLQVLGLNHDHVQNDDRGLNGGGQKKNIFLIGVWAFECVYFPRFLWIKRDPIGQQKHPFKQEKTISSPFAFLISLPSTPPPSF